jgi:outer membrane protein assembly factor BamC
MNHRYSLALVGVLLCTLWFFLQGCASQSEKAVYQKSKAAEPLEVPPDLSRPSSSDSVAVPGAGAASASDYYGTSPRPAVPTPSVGFQVPGVKVHRDGRWRWLEIEAEPGVVWVKARDFLLSEGFSLVREDNTLGIMETDFLDNLANEARGKWGRMLGRVFSTGLRDRYRVRVEPGPDPGTTLMYLTHQGMREMATSQEGVEIVSTYWTWRDSDPELEAEMMQRFILSLGVGPREAGAVVALKETQPRTELLETQGHYTLRVNDTFAHVWRRTSIALDRIGALVEDRNRDSGIYYMRVPERFIEEHADKSWFQKTFGGDNEQRLREQVQLHLSDIGDATLLSVHDKDGQRDDSQLARQLLELLESNFE